VGLIQVEADLHSLFQLGSPIKDSSPHVEVSRSVPFRSYSLFEITLFDGAVTEVISMEMSVIGDKERGELVCRKNE
jgi:hypothetical protein